jgi:hypothetical protein
MQARLKIERQLLTMLHLFEPLLKEVALKINAVLAILFLPSEREPKLVVRQMAALRKNTARQKFRLSRNKNGTGPLGKEPIKF